jgi:inorganic pyrophosphatase
VYFVYLTMNIRNYGNDGLNFVKVFIEIERGSNLKYEFNKETQSLELDRILPESFVYPYAYGFVPNTLANDGDELDVLLISDSTEIKSNTYDYGYIVGALIMEDEKGMDEKLLMVPATDYLENQVEDIFDMDQAVRNQLEWFFSNYKTGQTGKWSKVYGIFGKHDAVQLYAKYCAKYKQDNFKQITNIAKQI